MVPVLLHGITDDIQREVSITSWRKAWLTMLKGSTFLQGQAVGVDDINEPRVVRLKWRRAETLQGKVVYQTQIHQADKVVLEKYMVLMHSCDSFEDMQCTIGDVRARINVTIYTCRYDCGHTIQSKRHGYAHSGAGKITVLGRSCTPIRMFGLD